MHNCFGHPSAPRNTAKKPLHTSSFGKCQNRGSYRLLCRQREVTAHLPHVFYASPVFWDERGIEGDSYTNEIIVRLKSVDDFPVLQKSAEAYFIKDMKPSIDRWTYRLTLPHNAKKNAMITSSELHETGLFVYAEPNLLTLWPFEQNNNTRPDELDDSSIIYPNPAENSFYIDLDRIVQTQNRTAVSYDILFYNSQGNMLHQVKAKDGKVEINVSNLPGGIYFLNICDGISATYKAFKVFVKH
jgi:hypothetical protein